MKEKYDVIIIGGGPAGSTVGTLLSQKGYDVLLLERHKFPRFHIGESITAFGFHAFKALGVYDELKAMNYVQKKGLEFVMREGNKKVYFPSDLINEPGEKPWAFQMQRAKLDEVLLNNAKRKGVTVLEERLVKQVLFDGDRAVGVEFRDLTPGSSDDVQRVSARWIVDASGQGSILNRQLEDNWADDPLLEKKFAVYSHFKGVNIVNSDDELNFKLCVHDNRRDWAWWLPIEKDVVSLGVVLSQETVKNESKTKDLEAIFYKYAADIPHVDKLLQDPNVRRIEKFRCGRDYSYRAKRFYGPGWALVGDSGGFIDPIFSTGMQIAFNSAFTLAEHLDTALKSEPADARPLAAYQKKYDQFYRFNSMLVYLFYLAKLDYRNLNDGRFLWKNLEWNGVWDRLKFLYYGQVILRSNPKKVAKWGEQVLFGNPGDDNLLAKFLLMLSNNYEKIYARRTARDKQAPQSSELVEA
jgi:clorobiocin biosynthesis protein Clo-hal